MFFDDIFFALRIRPPSGLFATDKFAADFGANHFDPKSKLTLGEQIQNYLNNNLKATTPDKAPNYNVLPTTEPKDKPSRINSTTIPVLQKNR